MISYQSGNWFPMEFLVLFLDCWFISKVFGLKTLFFELLHAKPCRIIWKLLRKLSLGSETCEIAPKLWLWICPDLPRPVQEDKSLLQTSGNIFLRNYTFPFLLNKFVSDYPIEPFFAKVIRCIVFNQTSIFNPEAVIPHHKYKFWGVPGRAMPWGPRRAGQARPTDYLTNSSLLKKSCSS